MSSQQRRQDLGLSSTAAGGNRGSYASQQRPAAAPPALQEIETVIVPPRRVELQRAPRPLEWPARYGSPRIAFGEDDAGQFFTEYLFTASAGHIWRVRRTEHHIDGTTTDYGELDDAEAEEALEYLIEEAHDNIGISVARIGAEACEDSPSLTRQVIEAAIGQPNTSDADQDSAGAQGSNRAAQMLLAGGFSDRREDREVSIQDALTDFMHFAKAEVSETTFEELLNRAQFIFEDELAHPET